VVFQIGSPRSRSFPAYWPYGATRDEAEAAVEALALRVIADQIENEKVGQKSISFAALEALSCQAINNYPLLTPSPES
jgi:hypothetical protein